MTKEITQLGRYQIEAHLGAGAHADVYRATDPLLIRTVALKVLKPALIADEDAFARFTREAQVLASLVHPHIAWVWDMGEADGSYFIAMRYVDGKSLDMVIAERGRLPWKEALNLVEQVADGLQFALEDVEVWVIPAQTMFDLIPRHPALAMAVIRHLGERVLHYISLVEDLSLRSVEARLASTLLRNAELHEGQLIVPRREWTTFDEMAVRLGTVRDVLSRALKTLEAEGLLRVEKQAIVLLDAKGLEERSNR